MEKLLWKSLEGDGWRSSCGSLLKGWMEKLLWKSLEGDGWRSSCGSLLKGMDGDICEIVDVSKTIWLTFCQSLVCWK